MEKNEHLDTRSLDHKCLQSLIEVFLYIDGQLDDDRASDLDEHLKHCSQCFGRVEFEKMVKGYIKSRSGEEEPSESMVNSVTELISPKAGN